MSARQRWTILVYNLFVTIGLTSLGFYGETTGVLLWPAVALHATLSLLTARGKFGATGTTGLIRGAAGFQRSLNLAFPMGAALQ